MEKRVGDPGKAPDHSKEDRRACVFPVRIEELRQITWFHKLTDSHSLFRNLNPYVADALRRGGRQRLAVARQAAGLAHVTEATALSAGISAFAFQVLQYATRPAM